MNKNDFKLIPAYCLFNGVAINNQHGSYIQFLVENIEDIVLQERLRRAFEKHVDSVKKLKDCDSSFLVPSVIEFIKGSRNQIRKYVSSIYALEEKIGETNNIVQKKKSSEAAAVLLLDRILNDARSQRVTDIHIEENSIRFRVNGKLQLYMTLSEKRTNELVQRIKLLGSMNVLEKNKSQIGHFVYGNKSPLFIRVSSINVIDETYAGEEAIVLRLLDTSRIPLCVDELGFNESQLEKISSLMMEKNGLVIICGPTGSGKSTTAASILLEIKKKSNDGLKIISLEDPPEYYIPGVSQVKVDNHGNNYKVALNHVFRLDPDVIMIGEIRDELSASTALKAALTGHLVFATLHTGAVSEAVLRMESLGMDRLLLASVLKGVICQELNYIENEIKLYGDIGIPIRNFSGKIKNELTEDELEKLFIHETNYSEILSKTLEIFNKKNNEILKRERRMQKLWKEGKTHGKVYKRIV